MNSLEELKVEAYVREHLLKSGIVDELKRSNVFIWTIKAEPGKVFIAIDRSANETVDMDSVCGVIREFLAPLKREIEIQEITIEANCCYGVCHGCLNGDPEAQKRWIEP